LFFNSDTYEKEEKANPIYAMSEI